MHVGLYLRHSDHYRWFMHSYSHIIVSPLTSAYDFACTHLRLIGLKALICSREPWHAFRLWNSFRLYLSFLTMFISMRNAPKCLISCYEPWLILMSSNLWVEMEWPMLHGPPRHHLSEELVWVQSVPNLVWLFHPLPILIFLFFSFLSFCI